MVLKYTQLLDNKTGKCIATDKKIQGFEYQDATLSPFDNHWYITSYLENDDEYQRKILALRKSEKYQEITDAYDKACNYGVAAIVIPETKQIFYANRAWLPTWDEAIAGLTYQNSKSEKPVTTFVRLYVKYGDFMYKNVTLTDVTLDTYQALKIQLIDYRFNTLQVKRNALYTELEAIKSPEEVLNLVVDFGETLNEQTETNKIILNEPDTLN